MGENEKTEKTVDCTDFPWYSTASFRVIRESQLLLGIPTVPNGNGELWQMSSSAVLNIFSVLKIFLLNPFCHPSAI
jgi:hypothetical protein